MVQCDARRAIIVGAGPGGLAAAVALRRAGIDTIVCERVCDLHGAGSGLTLWPNATKALDHLGLMKDVERVSLPLVEIAMRTWRGQRLFNVSLDNVAATSRHAYGLALLRSELIAVLVKQVGSGSLRLGARITGFRDDAAGVTVMLHDGTELSGDLLIGADGLDSVVREHIFGRSDLRRAGYVVWRGIAAFAPSDPIGVTWMGYGTQFGLFPLANDRAYWFASAKHPHFESTAVKGGKEKLLDTFGTWAYPVREVIEATAEGAIICNEIYDRAPLKRWSKGSATLLGDAAHPATPTLGQGACQAMEDAVVLANCLSLDRNTSSALARYERRRLRRANDMTNLAWRIGRMGLWESTLGCWFRDRMIASVPERLRLNQLNKMFNFEF